MSTTSGILCMWCRIYYTYSECQNKYSSLYETCLSYKLQCNYQASMDKMLINCIIYLWKHELRKKYARLQRHRHLVILYYFRAGKITNYYSGYNIEGYADLQCTGLEDDISLCYSNLSYCEGPYTVAIDCS